MVLLVTGSSSGIGKEIVLRYAKEGYDVIINYNNNKEEAMKVLDEVKKYNVKAIVIKCDVSNEDEVKNMLEVIKKEYGKVDVLVNNAGISIDTTFEDKTIDNFRRILDVNLIGAFLVSKYISSIMDKGVIINISSTNGIDTNYVESLDYDASKAGLISLTHNLAKYFAPNIRVNAICPGWVNTNMNKNLDEDFIKNELSKIKLGRFAEASEIADAVYNISKCTYINDSVIRVDGGESA